MSQGLPPQKSDAARDGADGQAQLRRTILVAEDDADIRLMMSMLLEMKGYHVIEACDGQETLDVAQKERPDLILMDLQLPGIGGLEVTRSLKLDPETAGIKVVALTANAMKGAREEALQAGCAGYITKPIDVKRFVRDVTEYLRQ